MILVLDFTQILYTLFLFGPLIATAFFMLGRRSNRITEEKYKKIVRTLEDKVDELREEKAALKEELGEKNFG